MSTQEPVESELVDESELIEKAFEAFNDRFPFGLALLRPDLSLAWVSEGFGRLLGYPESDVIDTHVMDLVHPADISDVLPMAMAVVNDVDAVLNRPTAASSTEIPLRVKSCAGEWLPMCISGRVVDPDGWLVCVIRPAAERRALDLVLQELGKGSAGHSFDAILELLCSQFGLTGAWLIHDNEGDVVVHGPAWEDDLGDPAALLGSLRSRRELTVGHDERRWLIPIPTSSPDGLHGLLVMPAVRDGGPSPYDLYVIERTTTLAGVAFDRAETDRILRHGATTDFLTGMLNRRAFEERIDSIDDGPGCFPVGALFVDLDGFKVVNDSWGHEVGDKVLSAVAARLDNMTREEDIVARVGGDEFVVLCRGLDLPELEATRRRLEDGVSQPISFRAGTISVSVSIGVSIAQSAAELSTLITRSDRDMYRRKSRNGNRTVDFSTVD